MELPCILFTMNPSIMACKLVSNVILQRSCKILAHSKQMAAVNPPANLLAFFNLIGKLKHTKRTGWVLRNVPEPESIAGHMYRMAIMTMVIDKGQENLTRCLKIALVHDMAESIVGDLTPCCGVPKEEKHKREQEAMIQIKELVGSAGQELYDLWEEYETQSSPEAVIVKDLDRFDMILQAFEYEKQGSNNLQEFFDSTSGKFQHPSIKAWVEELYRQRESSIKQQKETV